MPDNKENTMQIKMIKNYKSYKLGETYEVPVNIGRAILNGLFAYRVN